MGFKSKQAGVISANNLKENEVAVEGTLIEILEPSKPGWKNNYKFELANGEEKIVFSTTILANRMEGVEVGDLVQITYLGTVPSKNGRPAHNWDVAVWEDDEEEGAEENAS